MNTPARRPVFRLPKSRPCRVLLYFLAGSALSSLIAFCAAWLLIPDPVADVRSYSFSPVLLDRDGRLIHARLSENEEWCLPVPLEEMGKWLPLILTTVEDKRFYSHPGVDFLALGRAVFQNVTRGRVVSGASTISSQLVRLSVPRKRTYAAKLFEFVGALKLERSMSKDEILEYYLNRAPFGGPIRGVEAASRLYFGKSAKDLSLGEAALLVGLLKGPTAYRPDKNPKAALRRRQMIIRQVAAKTDFPKDLVALALDERLPAFRPQMPMQAPHFADLAFAVLPKSGGIARSTLSPSAQHALDFALHRRLQLVSPSLTAAGIVVENRTGSIIAYTGNALFDPVKRREWVDCAVAPRSPGSTLKPFVYLEAVEQGKINPATLLADTPLNLGGEAPRNFDRRYRGPVTARTALAESLNAPAVRVLRAAGLDTVLDRLKAAGFAHMNRPRQDYGDSLVLGAGEVTLLELARAYAALASMGKDRPLVLLKPGAEGRGQKAFAGPAFAEKLPPSGELPPGLASAETQRRCAEEGALPLVRQLYTDGAAWLITDILNDTTRLPLLSQLARAGSETPVAFKTGTSYGLRDAWTAAYNSEYTVVLWFGRSDGAADPALTGISLAAPAAIELVLSLSRNAPPAAVPAPASVGRVPVCVLSGAAPSPACPSVRMVPVLKAVHRILPCTLHVLRNGRTEIAWPPELEDFNRKRFAAADASRAVLISTPLPGAKYIITPGARRQPIPLKAEGVSYPVYWYADGEYLGEQTRQDLPLYWVPLPGKRRLSLLDAEERTASAEVQVVDLAEQADDPPLLE